MKNASLLILCCSFAEKVNCLVPNLVTKVISETLLSLFNPLMTNKYLSWNNDFSTEIMFFPSNVKVEGPLFLPGSIDLVGREGKRPRWGERRKAPGLLYINSKYSPDILWRTRHSPNSSDEVIFCYIMLLLSHGHFIEEIIIFKVQMSDQICVCFSNVNPLCSSFSFISLWSLLNPVRSNWSKEFNSPNIGGFYLLFIE